MRKILFSIILIFHFTSCSQTAKLDFTSGVLWQIESGTGMASYIFGTIHLYPKTEMELSEKVISTLLKCNVLALERKVLNRDDHQKLADFEMPDVFLESNKVIVAEYGNDLVSMEGELIMKAIKAEMILTGLETTDESLDILKEVSNLLKEEKIFVREYKLADYKKSLRLYRNESINKYYDNSRVQMGDNITNLLVDKRNKNWIENIEFLIEQDKTFIAVGIGHLGGENGILNLLAEKGYQINKVE